MVKKKKDIKKEIEEKTMNRIHNVILDWEFARSNRIALNRIYTILNKQGIQSQKAKQKEFLKDLLKIIALKNIQVVIATHAPAIINDRWDLVYNLQPSA